ncbi:MAG: hypothetical protein U1D30_01550 [Planctomycetota bacterium]
MQSVKLKNGLAKWTLLLGVGVSTVTSMSLVLGGEQSTRLPEPQGIPVVRTRTGQYGPRPFSAEYYTAWQTYQARQKMIAEMRNRSTPPTTRMARQKALDAREHHLHQAENMRKEARPNFVIHHRRAENEISDGLIEATPVAWNSAETTGAKKVSFLQKIWGTPTPRHSETFVVEGEQVVRAEPIVAGTCSKSTGRGLLARLMNRGASSAPCDHAIPETEIAEIRSVESVPLEQVAQEDSTVTHHVVLKPWSNHEEAGEVPQIEEWESIDGELNSVSPAESAENEAHEEIPSASKLPELPEVTAASVPEVAPMNYEAKPESTTTASPVTVSLPELESPPANAATPIVTPNRPPAATQSKPATPKKLYDLPTIPEDVMRKYKAK